MSRVKIDFGIDLGTTNSVLSYMDKGEICVQEIDRSRIMPSCVSYKRNGAVHVGIGAFNLKPSQKHSEFKREMGTNWKEKKRIKLDEEVNAEELSTEVLKKLKTQYTNEIIKAVVVTVPAKFDFNQVAATKRAGEKAGFQQVEILQEPIAAAFLYGQKNAKKNGKFVVFDFGGGTFDSSLVESKDGVLTVISSEGNNQLGGKNLDSAIVKKVLEPILKDNFNIDDLGPNERIELSETLMTVAEELKISLSTSGEVDLLTALEQLGSDADGIDMEIDSTFYSEDVFGHLDPLFDEAIGLCEKLILSQGLTINDIDELVLVGGPTQIPYFRNRIAARLKTPDTSLNPMTAIAEGAALYASTINSKLTDHGTNPTDLEQDKQSESIVELDIQYPATTTSSEAAVGIKRRSSNEEFSVILDRSGVVSAKHQLDDVIMVQVANGRPNYYEIKLYNSDNQLVKCSPNSFTIIQGTDIDGGAPLAYHIGMEILDKRRGKIFTPFRGLEKDKTLPLVGKTDRNLYTSSAIRPGIQEDRMVIPIYFAEGDARDSRSIVNIYMDSIEINGTEVEKLIPENSQVEFTLRIDLSQNVILEADFPQLEVEMITKEMVFPARPVVTKKQIDAVISEIEKCLKLLNSEDIYHDYDRLNDSLTQLRQEYKQADQSDFQKIFGSFRNLLLQIDKANEANEWPRLLNEITEAKEEYEEMAIECINNKLPGWERDQRMLGEFENQITQLRSSSSKDMNRASELLEEIKGESVRMVARHQGKDLFSAMIRDINNRFNSISWKNQNIARAEVNKGIQLVNSGANEESLSRCLQAIVAQMDNPGDVIVRS